MDKTLIKAYYQTRDAFYKQRNGHLEDSFPAFLNHHNILKLIANDYIKLNNKGDENVHTTTKNKK